MDSGQLPLTLEEMEVAEAERADTAFKAAQVAKSPPVRRKKLPDQTLDRQRDALTCQVSASPI